MDGLSTVAYAPIKGVAEFDFALSVIINYTCNRNRPAVKDMRATYAEAKDSQKQAAIAVKEDIPALLSI